MAILTLLTDFGMRDSYVAQMKGVILNDCPGVEIVDISHDIPRHNVVEGAFVLETVVPYFASGAVHVAVVDPEVGGRRWPIVVECKGATLVGPDNGLLEKAVSRLGFVAAYRIDLRGRAAQVVSPTFHGRDVFAKTGALLASGRASNSVGPPISKLVSLNLPEPVILKREIRCLVLHIDAFGNIITDVPNRALTQSFHLGDVLGVSSRTGNWRARFVRTYSDVSRGEMIMFKGSQGYLEIAMREQAASEITGLKSLAEIKLSVME